jgi:protein-disulfide isomerase-like protein with CxxC motif
MGGLELKVTLGPVDVTATQALHVTRHIADRIAAEHPHALDEDMPRLAGRLTGRDPDAASGLRELLAALGLPTNARDLRALKAQAAKEQAVANRQSREGS